MEIITPGSALQVTITVVLIAAGIALGIFLARSSAETGKVLLVSGIVLMIIEVLKEVFLYQVSGSYPWSDFPFQLCSIPMYLCVLYYFFRKRWMEQFVMVYSLIGGIAALVVPGATFSIYIFLTVHSIFWHFMLLMLGLFLAVRQTEESVRLIHFIPVGLAYFIFAWIAVALNAAFYRVSEGTMNMFFLGPGWPNMFILNDIYTDSGWLAASLGMIGVSEAAGFAAYLLVFLCKTVRKNPKSAPDKENGFSCNKNGLP